jgi:glucose-1-phosphate cytidylyltransferase
MEMGVLNIYLTHKKNGHIFTEKPKGDGAVINGGFFILSPKVLDLIEGDNTSWEEEPLSHLAQNNELMSFKHDGFWQPMDTLRDRNNLEDMWSQNLAPWKTWK